jgi:hypothetical protein
MQSISKHLIASKLKDKYSNRSLVLAFRDLWKVWNPKAFNQYWSSKIGIIAYNDRFIRYMDSVGLCSLFEFNKVTDAQFLELIKLTETYEKLAAFG